MADYGTEPGIDDGLPDDWISAAPAANPDDPGDAWIGVQTNASAAAPVGAPPPDPFAAY